MIPAKNNIIVQIQGSTPAEYAIMNPITGSFDLMGEREHAWFTADEPRPRLDLTPSTISSSAVMPTSTAKASNRRSDEPMPNFC